jgi:Fe2+ or Zn2+ uptake regulation protein
MTTLDCRSTAPHAHSYVAGPEWIDSILRSLRSGKNRVTQPRVAVLQWIADRDAPFTAEEAVAALDDSLSTGSRATIYRFLLWLREAGWLSRVHRNDRDHALVRQLPGHHQAVCLVCGDTLTIGGCDLSSLIGQSLLGTGFAVTGHNLEIFGTCQRCKGP